MKHISIIFIILSIVITSCKSIDTKERESLKKNVIFKQLMNKSETVTEATISGSMQISGNKTIPAVFISFSAKANLINKTVILSLSVLSKPLIDLYMSDSKFILVNHTDNNYIELNDMVVDFSNILGFNFNPLELVYILQGFIPFNENMQIIEFTDTNPGYKLNLTHSTAEYTIVIDDAELIQSAFIQNQYFDPITIEILSYTQLEDNTSVPMRVRMKPSTGNTSMTFIVRSVTKTAELKPFTNKENYILLDDPDMLKIKL